MYFNMSKKQIYIYSNSKNGMFLRMIFTIVDEENEPEQFHSAYFTEGLLKKQKQISLYEANCALKDNKLKLVDLFEATI